jgi:hypothetical protein
LAASANVRYIFHTSSTKIIQIEALVAALDLPDYHTFPFRNILHIVIMYIFEDPFQVIDLSTTH